jgi:hypothetical protein
MPVSYSFHTEVSEERLLDAEMIFIHTWMPGRSDAFCTNSIRSRVRQKDNAHIWYVLWRTRMSVKTIQYMHAVFLTPGLSLYYLFRRHLSWDFATIYNCFRWHLSWDLVAKYNYFRRFWADISPLYDISSASTVCCWKNEKWKIWVTCHAENFWICAYGRNRQQKVLDNDVLASAFFAYKT